MIEHEEERLAGSNTTTPTTTPSTTETAAPVANTEVPATEPASPTIPAIPPLPSNFEVNEDELNSLTEEERAAMSAANEE